MFIAYIIVAALLSAVLVFSAVGKLTKNPQQVETLSKIGVPMKTLPMLAALEIAAAVGLIVGIFYAPLGIAAAIGVVLYFVGAVITHVRGKDFKGISGPSPLLVVGAVSLVLRALSV